MEITEQLYQAISLARDNAFDQIKELDQHLYAAYALKYSAETDKGNEVRRQMVKYANILSKIIECADDKENENLIRAINDLSQTGSYPYKSPLT